MKKNTLITILAVLVLLLTACQAGSEAADAPEVAPKAEATQAASSSEKAVASTSTDVLFDPAIDGNADSTGLVYENLLKLESGELIPALALEGLVSGDGLDYIINLRPGTTFHDGSVVNADAVIANFDRWSNKANAVEAWSTYFGGYKGDADAIYDGVEKVDDLTILVHLNEQDGEFLNKLADPIFAIVNPDALAASSFGSAVGIDGGTGAYMIGSWSNEVLMLEPYVGYWNSDSIPASGMDINLGN